MSRVMHIRINRRRLVVHRTSSEDEVFRAANRKLQWPKNRAYLEWSEGCVVEIRDESELRLACRLVSETLYSEARAWKEESERIEAAVEAHMAAPDSDVGDDTMESEDDMTVDDFYMVGFRHEIM